MEIFGKSYRVPAILIISILLVIIFAVSIIVYWQTDESAKTSGFMGSLAAGMLVAIVQLFIAWYDYYKNEQLRKIELLEILYDRDSRGKYEKYIRGAKSHIDVMGVTAARFFAHFADLDKNASEGAKVIIYALERGVSVRILLPSADYIPNNKRNAASVVLEQYKNLSERYDRIELRYFNHTPAHSIFRIDDTSIIGPVFPEVESKYTPAMHLKNTSPIAIKYIDYFETEWKEAKKA